jgi:DNA-directed RNA polymerase subunit RPC12/RpoP
MSYGYFAEQEKQERKRMAAKRPRPGSMPDAEDFYTLRKCCSCSELWSFKTGSLVATACPGCGSKWLYGNPDEVAWAC